VGAATEKARVANEVCVRGTVNSGVQEDRRDVVGAVVADPPDMVEMMPAVS